MQKLKTRINIFSRRNNTIFVDTHIKNAKPYITDNQYNYLEILLRKKYGDDYLLPNIQFMNKQDASELIDFLKSNSTLDVFFVNIKKS